MAPGAFARMQVIVDPGAGARSRALAGTPRAHGTAMLLAVAVGVLIGVVLGTIVVGFLAVNAYDRGYEDALERRGERLAELRARHLLAVRRLRERKAS